MADQINLRHQQHHQHHYPHATRVIRINQIIQPAKYCRNSISTSKYNIATFLPKFLFEQFRKYSNIFFFLIVMLQVSLPPLFFFLMYRILRIFIREKNIFWLILYSKYQTCRQRVASPLSFRSHSFWPSRPSKKSLKTLYDTIIFSIHSFTSSFIRLKFYVI